MDLARRFTRLEIYTMALTFQSTLRADVLTQKFAGVNGKVMLKIEIPQLHSDVC